MRTMRLESPTGVTGTCGYEPYRGRLYIVLARNGERLTCEIPLGEMASRCQLSGKTLDAARARWEAANLTKRERRHLSPAATDKEKARDRDRKRAQRKGMRGGLLEPVDEAAVLVTAAPKLGFPEAEG